MSMAISDDEFSDLVEQMITVGGDWKVTLSKDGNVLAYAGKTYAITLAHANAMFTTIPRKAAG